MRKIIFITRMNRKELIKLKFSIISNWEKKIKDSGITITDLAIKSGISRTTIYHAISGKTVPNIDTINKIEDVLNG